VSIPVSVPFWFDPICPWAWIASRWLIEVEQVRPVVADWRIMSLSYLNLVQRDPASIDVEYAAFMSRSWGPARVCTAAVLYAGPEILGPLYTAIGTRLHAHRRRDDQGVIPESLAEVGIPGSIAEAATNETMDAMLIDSHNQGFDEIGLDVGTPLMRVQGKVFFGPVISRIPRGEEAGELWDAISAVGKFDDFFELKRRRDRKPDFG
jgi:hypothetical protein